MKNQSINQINQIKSIKLKNLIRDHQIDDINQIIKSLNDFVFDIKSIQINKIKINDMIYDFNNLNIIDFINKYSMYIISLKNIDKIKKDIKDMHQLIIKNRISRKYSEKMFNRHQQEYLKLEKLFYKIDRILIDNQNKLSSKNYVFLSRYRRIIKDMMASHRNEMRYIYQASKEYMISK